MIDRKQKLLLLIAHWRQTAHEARLEAETIDNLLVRGHLLGMSEGLELAANQIEAQIDEDK